MYPVGADEPPDAPDIGARNGKQAPGVEVIFVGNLVGDAAVDLVEPPRHLAGHLDVRDLVFADGHGLGAKGEDVRRLPH